MSEVTSIEERLHFVIAASLGPIGGKMKPESRFAEDLGADSLDMIQITMDMEESFHIDITDSEAESVRTIGDAIKLVEAKVASQSTVRV